MNRITKYLTHKEFGEIRQHVVMLVIGAAVVALDVFIWRP
jgi:hypothetical protein